MLLITLIHKEFTLLIRVSQEMLLVYTPILSNYHLAAVNNVSAALVEGNSYVTFTKALS